MFRIAGRWALMLALAGFAGCASTEPYRQAVKGMVDTGDAVDPLLRPNLTPGEEALRDAWRYERQRGRELVADPVRVENR